MLQPEVIEFVSFWGGIASLIAFAGLLVKHAKSTFNKLNEKKLEQEARCKEFEEEINQLAHKGCSYQTRQDIYLYASSMLSHHRHIEMRMRSYNIAMHAMCFFIGSVGIIVAARSDIYLNAYVIDIPAIVVMALITTIMLFANIKVAVFVNHYSEMNDSFSNGYLDKITEQIETKYVDQQTK